MKNNLFLIPLIFIVAFVFQQDIQAADKQISYQGRLTNTDGSPVADASYSLEFLLYTDSTGGSIVWAESADVVTADGLFSYLIGSVNSLSSSLFQQHRILFLELRVSGEPVLPRSRLGAMPYSFSANELSGYDSDDNLTIQTDSENRSLTIFDSLGNSYITLQQKDGDSALILPESAVNAYEILDEPGIASSIDLNLTTLITNEMIDLTKVTIEIPDDGYIVLIGKCYFLLSGTTGANSAIVQIDQNENGGTQFPYYTIAGLSGYVNSGTNYFPAFVTRTYYASQGTYTFRLEAKANNPLPAVAQSWDHILTATYYPTSYYGVEAVVADQIEYSNAVPISVENRDDSKQYYKVDLRELEIKEHK